MTRARGVFEKSPSKELFIGWAKAPAVDRRFLLGAIPLGLAGTTAAGIIKARSLPDPGAGAWLTNATHAVEGVVSRAPYPLLRVADPAAPFGMRTVLIVAQGKCTSGLDLDAVDGRMARARGVLIERGNRRMLEVPPFLGAWLEASEGTPTDLLRAPPEEDLGTATLSGMIMDSKCFFGVMKPARGRTHKACAALCIRGGIPPSFWARGRDGREAVLLMTDNAGGPLKDDILPYVADPVRVEGALRRVGDLVQFRINPEAIVRV